MIGRQEPELVVIHLTKIIPVGIGIIERGLSTCMIASARNHGLDAATKLTAVI